MKKFFTVVFIFFFAFFWIVGMFQSCSETTPETTRNEDEFDAYDSTADVHTVSRRWLDYHNEETYATQYSLQENWHTEAFQEREKLEIEYWESDEDFWEQVYMGLYKQSKNQLDFIQDSLQNIGDSLKLNRTDFAYMVVSFVQDIPYNYVLPDSCDDKHSDFPCVPLVKYGILSPVEFLCTLQGDCDTRTVLLFTLLRNFGYEPVIVNSHEYLHSMLALDIPTSGDYLEYKGKRYAFWETTNVGWLPGMLPPDMNNTNYWNVILDL